MQTVHLFECDVEDIMRLDSDMDNAFIDYVIISNDNSFNRMPGAVSDSGHLGETVKHTEQVHEQEFILEIQGEKTL